MGREIGNFLLRSSSPRVAVSLVSLVIEKVLAYRHRAVVILVPRVFPADSKAQDRIEGRTRVQVVPLAIETKRGSASGEITAPCRLEPVYRNGSLPPFSLSLVFFLRVAESLKFIPRAASKEDNGR